MTESEKLFDLIINEIPNCVQGKMFGAKCIKSNSSKTAAFFWKESMVFKLDDQPRKEALKLKDTKVGSHLYAPEKKMKGWISIPEEHSEKWANFAEKALKYVDKLKKGRPQ